MTAQEFLTAAILDARVAYAAYATMTTDALIEMQIAHQISQAHATTPEGLAIGGGRLALIAAVLQQRASVEPDPRD